MHFFSPVDKMPLVELIVGERTSDEALARAYDVVRQIGKTPIVVQDSRGFFTSRVFGTLVMEGAALLAEGLAPMSVERAALQAGFPAGPLTLLDEVTLTLALKIRDEAAKAGAGDDLGQRLRRHVLGFREGVRERAGQPAVALVDVGTDDEGVHDREDPGLAEVVRLDLRR